MDESSEPAEVPSGSSLIPLVLAILALLVGGSGIYFGYTAAQQSQSIQDEIEAQSGRSSASVSALEGQMAQVSKDLEGIQNNLEAIKTKMRMDRDAQTRALSQIAEEMASNREQINQNTRDIAEIPEQIVAAPPPAPVRSPTPSEEPETPRNPAGDDPGEGTVHTIASGDTLARLAAKYNVSLSQLLAANPTVDPRRLQIGQQIQIPQN
jgi:LysM repeat protein